MASERILLAEDNPQNRRLAQFLLKSRGYLVYEATTGPEAVDLARKHLPDLVLMDLQLPGLDGFTATRMLKEDPGTKEIPVVAMTAYAMKGDREKAVAAGCDGYITKPIDTKEFPVTVSHYLASARTKKRQRAVESEPTILVVDDNEQNLALIRAILRRHGYDPRLARSGDEALHQVFQHAPDLIILDVMMPGMDGIEVCRRLKANEETRLIPIVVMTVLDQPEDRVRGIEAGADDFLTKPVNQPELIARVKTALTMKRTIDRRVGTLLNIKDHLSKFVPMAVRRLVEEHPEAPQLDKREQDVSVLFVDLSGYTKLSLSMDADTVNGIVERYFSHFLDAVQEHGGDIAETAGDGMMVVFQDDDPRGHARNAARAALKIVEITDRLNQAHPGAWAPIAVHLALNSGRATVGSTRFEGVRGTRWTFTASGPVTNLAARLGTAGASGTILAGPETATRIAGDFVLESLGPQVYKNLAAVEVYRLIGEKTE